MKKRYIVMFNNNVVRQQDSIENEIDLMKIGIVVWILDLNEGNMFFVNDENKVIFIKVQEYPVVAETAPKTEQEIK